MVGCGGRTKVWAIACLLQLCGALRPWNDLRVRHASSRTEGYYQIPFSTDSPLIRGYVKVQPENDFNMPLDFYCFMDDPSACFMFDKKGQIAGVQISFLLADLDEIYKKDYDLSNVNFKDTNFFNIPAYSVRFFFTNPEKLTEEGRKIVNETGEGLWVYLEGKLVEIPRYQPSSDRFGDFYKQGCVRSMGLHYFYKMDKSLKNCTKAFPLYVLYDDGSLVGFGFATAGEGSAGPSRDWFEHPGKQALDLIAPNRAGCIDDLVDKYGMTSMHVYLVEKPWSISCSFYDSVINTLQDLISMFSPF